MKNFSTFLENPFTSRNIGLAKLLAFTTDHVQRLTANNPGGQWSVRIAATEAALAGVNATFVADTTKLGLRKARKQGKRAFRKALRGRVAPLHVAVMAKFGEDAAVLQEIFPGGRQGLARCADDGLESRLQSLVTALTAHAADLDATVVSAAGALLTEWQAVYQASEASTGAKASAEVARRAARSVLERELFLNLLALAQAFPDEPEKLALYMQQSLLRGRAAKKPA